MRLCRHSSPISSESATVAQKKQGPVRAGLAAAGLALALVRCDQLRSKDSPPLPLSSSPVGASCGCRPGAQLRCHRPRGRPSSALRSIGYCESRQILELDFTRGTVYRYYAVPAEIHRAFMRAPSKGRYLNSVFKPLGYRYERLR
jgi:hypothetical protein